MKPERNVHVCQIIPRNSDDDVAWVFIDVEDTRPDNTGSHARIKIEFPLRVDTDDDRIMTDSEAMRKAKALLASAIEDLG